MWDGTWSAGIGRKRCEEWETLTALMVENRIAMELARLDYPRSPGNRRQSGDAPEYHLPKGNRG